MRPLKLHEHRDVVHRPWELLQDIVQTRVQELRVAAEMQACSRQSIIWHPYIQPGNQMQSSCFSLPAQYSSAGR